MLARFIVATLVLGSFAAILLGGTASASTGASIAVGSMEGWVVDSITVSGNEKTKDFAVLREMELRPGALLDSAVVARDRRYIRDLGLFADVVFALDSLAPGRCALRITVKERSTYFLKTILPVVNYDFEKGFSYGIRWSDRNFRGRRERVYASYTKDADENDNASLGWVAPWIGWSHVEVGADFWYFSRKEAPVETNVLETVGGGVRIGLPLTESRMNFVQLLGRMAFEARERGDRSGFREERRYLVPFVGLRADTRDSQLRPTRGIYFFVGLSNWTAISGPARSYYRTSNDLRIFRSISPRGVLAFQSNLGYYFGEYPEYLSVGLGGSGNLRGYSASKFSGAHIWYQSAEWRYTVLPRKVFRLPIAGNVDVVVSLVLFLDSGIVWNREEQFASERFHGGAGFGIRIYSPFQDVVRIDLGFNRRGDAFPYVRTGIRF